MKKLLLVLCTASVLMISCIKIDSTFAMDSISLENSYDNMQPVDSMMAAGGTVRFVCYGNSITHGAQVQYPAELQAGLREYYGNNNIQVINAGQPGWTAPMAEDALDSLVLSHNPDVVSIVFGINDLYQGVETEEYRQSLTNMIQRLQQQGIKVLIMSPTPLNNDQNGQLIGYCSSARIVADSMNVGFFHLHKAMVDKLERINAALNVVMPDGVHYNSDGYRYIADEMLIWWKGIE